MDRKLFWCRICGTVCKGSHTLYNHLKLHNINYSDFNKAKNFFSTTENYKPIIIKSSLVRIKPRRDNMDKKELLEENEEETEEEVYNDWRCAECNFKLDRKYKYCPNCGAELDWERVVNDEEFY